MNKWMAICMSSIITILLAGYALYLGELEEININEIPYVEPVETRLYTYLSDHITTEISAQWPTEYSCLTKGC